MRLEHGLMLFIAVLIGSVIAQKMLYSTVFLSVEKIILTFLTVLFLEASTFALNDYYDLEIDKKNKRLDRPLIRGDIAPKTALYLFFVLFPLGILSSFFVNFTCFIIALVTAVFAILYDVKMKKIKLLGNFYIAYAMAIPFIFGGAAVLEKNTLTFFVIPPVVFIIALIAFFAGVGREIMKDVMDFEGDRKRGVKSFPSYVGIRASNVLSAIFYIIAIALSFIPFFMESYGFYYRNMYYLSIVLVTDTMLLSTSLQLIFKKQVDMKFYRMFTLVAIFVGLLAFLIGVFTG